jgi:hypothetical protein
MSRTTFCTYSSRLKGKPRIKPRPRGAPATNRGKTWLTIRPESPARQRSAVADPSRAPRRLATRDALLPHLLHVLVPLEGQTEDQTATARRAGDQSREQGRECRA